MNIIEYRKFVKIFAEKLRSMFIVELVMFPKCAKVYSYNRDNNIATYSIRFNCDLDAEISTIEILEKWIKFCFWHSSKVDNELSQIYNKISIDDIELFIRISCYMNDYILCRKISKIKALIGIFKELNNIKFEEFMSEHRLFYFRGSKLGEVSTRLHYLYTIIYHNSWYIYKNILNLDISAIIWHIFTLVFNHD